MVNIKGAAMTKVDIKHIWICEECGREYEKLPFPTECACGNWCEDFFRLKDRWDFEDDRAGKPLLGIKYDPEVLKERNKKLGVRHTEEITVPIGEEDVTIDFKSMTKDQLRNYLKEKGSNLAGKILKKEDMVLACERLDSLDELW